MEHRAKTGLTPLMEAASGGYVEVARVLLERGGADVNAAPAPQNKETALTIAAERGHGRFVQLLLEYGAHLEAKNKKGKFVNRKFHCIFNKDYKIKQELKFVLIFRSSYISRNELNLLIY